MKEYLQWFKENILMSRTMFLAAIFAIAGSILWVIFVPKDLASWVALGTFYGLVYGWATAVNKKGDSIDAQVEIAKIGQGK